MATLKSLSVVSKPKFRNDKLTIQNLNKHLSNLEIGCIKNDNIIDKHLGKNGLYLNKKGKGRNSLNLL